MREVEQNFEKYIDSLEAEKLFDNFFSAIRKAYIAGYKAASTDTKPSEGLLLHLVSLEDGTAAKQ